MRIVNREEFLKQPPGTIFAKYKTMNAPGLNSLEGVWESDKGPKYTDFINQSLDDVSVIDCTGSGDMYDKCLAAEADSTLSLPTTFDDTMRDGLFDEDQLFLIWEKQDVEKLVAKLQNSLATAYIHRPKTQWLKDVRVQQADVKNSKNHIYTVEALESVVKTSSIRGGALPGMLEPLPADQGPIVPIEKMSHTVHNLRMVGDTLTCDIEILHTPHGKILQRIIDAGETPDFVLLGAFYPSLEEVQIIRHYVFYGIHAAKQRA